LGLYRREAKAIGIVGSCEDCDAVGVSGGDALVFVRVNQVLVRLWACLLACLTGCAVLRGGRQRVGCVQRCCVHATGRDPVVLSESDPCVRNISRSSRERCDVRRSAFLLLITDH